MAKSPEYDFFVSYARADNAARTPGTGWVERFVQGLLDEHRSFTGGRTLRPFFDRRDILSFADWESEIFHKGLTRSRLFLGFLSPAYFASEICRREWRTWIEREIATHILSIGSAPVYFVEVPGFLSRPALSEHEVARKVAELCQLPAPLDRFLADLPPVVKEARRRQIVSWTRDDAAQPFLHAGEWALQQDDLRRVLHKLAEDLDARSKDARRAAESPSTVPPYNKRFSGRLDELVELRRMLKDDRAGVVCGIAGLGGIGKTELAYTYAHAYAGVYPGGRFHIPCEGRGSLREAVLILGDVFRDRIGDEERKHPDTYFAAIVRCLRKRLEEKGHVLLVLDNVTDAALITAGQTDEVTALGSGLHLLATTRLLPAAQAGWLTLGELAPDDALSLLDKYRPFADESERQAGGEIVRRLGGFALAIELVAAGLAAHPTARYADVVSGLGLEDLDVLAEDRDVALRRHNHEKRLAAVLGPTLASLTSAERRAVEYAAFLAPDHVPLPWLRELVVAGFPELATPGRWGDGWGELCRNLERRALFTSTEGEDSTPRLVRVHRLVQELVRRNLSAAELSTRAEAVEHFVKVRDAALQRAVADWEKARWELEPFDALARHWDEMGHPHTAWLVNQAGIRWHHLAEWTRAEPLMRRALAIDEQSFGPSYPNVAVRLNNLAQLLQDTNRLPEAEPLMWRALEIDEQSFGPNHPKIATDLSNLGSLLQATGRVSEAEPLIHRALDIDEQVLGTDHPNVARDLNNLAQLLQTTGRLAEAEPLIERAVAIFERSLGENHPDFAKALGNWASLLQATGRLTEAEPLMARVVTIFEQSLSKNHPNVATALNNLALLLHAMNRLAEAEPLMRRALAIDEQSFGPQAQEVATNLNNLAQLLQDREQLSEAELLMRRALAIDTQLFGPEHPNVARDLTNLAALLLAMKQPTKAEPLMRRSVEVLLTLSAQSGTSHPHLQVAVSNYWSLLRSMGVAQLEIRQRIEALLASYGMSQG